ncbi:ABC transporter permease [Bacillus sp. FJAT-28004]|uniref:ABC transporter permease n=1 Tax=Bacillus sp. FJAT-28004 TaxID=1679165 RepID=UPI0007C63FA5|nr:ABC transporter permease [Bacillus sp. FJAT-28004]
MKFKNKFKKILFFIVLYILSVVALTTFLEIPGTMKMYVEIVNSDVNGFQVFYAQKEQEFTEKNSSRDEYEASRKKMKLDFLIDSNVDRIRFDLGEHPGKIEISSIYFKPFFKKNHLSISLVANEVGNEISNIKKNDDYIEIVTKGPDPFIYFPLTTELREQNMIDNKKFKTLICNFVGLLISSVLFILLVKRRIIISFYVDIFSNRRLIFNLAKNDFKTKYAGSYLGFMWGYVQPIVTILVYWFVFQVGLKVMPADENIPFAIWFISGLIPWFFFADSLSNATNSFIEYSFLVKKVVFKISILPIVKILSSLFVHCVFLIFLYIVYLSYGNSFHVYNIQLIYYSFCTILLVVGISYFTSAIVVFFKDLGQIISIIIQVGMWLTPIMWSEKIISDRYNWIFKINPMYYVVQGYRDSLFYKAWFYENIYLTLWFWFFTIMMFLLGVFIFKKLKPHFADVL